MMVLIGALCFLFAGEGYTVQMVQADSIKGVINFEGAVRRRRPVQMDADRFCKAAHEAQVLSEEFIHGEGDKTLANVFVYVSDGLKGKDIPAPTENAEIDQHGCIYIPHVLGVVVGQNLEIINSDNTLHNVNCKPSRNAAFNRSMGPGTKLEHKFTREELGIPFKCDVHPWMSSFVNVMEHPFFAVSALDGTYEIKGLPPGEYTVSVWYESNRYRPSAESVKVTVAEGAPATADFTFSRGGGAAE